MSAPGSAPVARAVLVLGEKLLVTEESNHLLAKQEFGGLLVDRGHEMPCAVLVEPAATGDGVGMGMPPQVGSGGVDGCDHAGPCVGRSLLDQLGHRLVAGFEQLAEQGAPVQKVRSRELGQGEGPQTVADLFGDLFTQEGSQDGASFGVAGRTDAASFAGEGDQVLVLAGIAHHPGEAALEIAAIEIAAIEKGVDESIEIDRPPLEKRLDRSTAIG